MVHRDVLILQDEWLPAVSGTLRPLSHARYEKIVSTYVAQRDIGGVPLRALSGGHLTALYSELEREGLSGRRQGASRTPFCAAR